MKVYVVSHFIPNKQYKVGYMNILVGAEKHNLPHDDGMYVDNDGENISHLNDSYCELTGLYWIWKNVSSDIVGLVHYRRFFIRILERKRIRFRDDYYLKNPMDASWCHVLTEKEIEKLLSSADVLVKMSRKFHWNIREKLIDCTNQECVDTLEVALKRTDKKMFESFQKYLKRHSHVLFNMFIGKKAVVDKYCEWLFPLLEKVDKLHKKKTGSRYQNREIGYLGEVLFGFWLEQNKIAFQSVDTLIPGKSRVSTIDGITIEGGTNVYYKKSLFVNAVSRYTDSFCSIIVNKIKRVFFSEDSKI